MPYIDFIAPAGGGGGGTITDTFDTGLITVDISGVSGTLDLFDSTLGALTSAILTLTGNLVVTITITNIGGTPSPSITVTALTDLYCNSSIGSLSTILGDAWPNVMLSQTTGPQVVPALSSYSTGPVTDSDVAVYDLVSILADMQTPGGGTFTIGLASISGQQTLGGGPFVSGSSTSWAAGLAGSITYIYT